MGLLGNPAFDGGVKRGDGAAGHESQQHPEPEVLRHLERKQDTRHGRHQCHQHPDGTGLSEQARRGQAADHEAEEIHRPGQTDLRTIETYLCGMQGQQRQLYAVPDKQNAKRQKHDKHRVHAG